MHKSKAWALVQRWSRGQVPEPLAEVHIDTIVIQRNHLQLDWEMSKQPEPIPLGELDRIALCFRRYLQRWFDTHRAYQALSATILWSKRWKCSHCWAARKCKSLRSCLPGRQSLLTKVNNQRYKAGQTWSVPRNISRRACRGNGRLQPVGPRLLGISQVHKRHTFLRASHCKLSSSVM